CAVTAAVRQDQGRICCRAFLMQTMLNHNPSMRLQDATRRKETQGFIDPAFSIRGIKKHAAEAESLFFSDFDPFGRVGANDAAMWVEASNFQIFLNCALCVRTCVDKHCR